MLWQFRHHGIGRLLPPRSSYTASQAPAARWDFIRGFFGWLDGLRSSYRQPASLLLLWDAAKRRLQ